MLLLALLLAGCREETPKCPEPASSDYDGAPTATIEDPNQLTIDVFNRDGHKFWGVFTDENVAAINQDYYEENATTGYTVGELSDTGSTVDPSLAYATSLFVTSADSGEVAEFKQVSFNPTGESMAAPFTESSAPQFHVELDKYDGQEENELGGYDEFFLVSGWVPEFSVGFVRTDIASKILNSAGYPTLKTSDVWFGNNVWGHYEPYLLLQALDGRFEETFPDNYGGNILGIYKEEDEGGNFYSDDWKCELQDCSEADGYLAGLKEFITTYNAETDGSFYEASQAYIDWDSPEGVFNNICFSGMIGHGDNWRNGNNTKIIFNDEGLMTYAMNGFDGTFGLYDNLITGWTPVIMYCGQDEECLEHLLDKCENEAYPAFVASDPLAIARQRCQDLETLGMKREYDETVCSEIESFIEMTQETFIEQIHNMRECGWDNPWGC